MNESNEANVPPNSRRDFFRNLFLIAGAGAFVQLLKSSKAFAALNPVTSPECKSPATALGYVNNLAVALKNHKITKTAKTANGKTWTPLEQHCGNCMFFGKNQGKKVPSCELLPGCAVSPSGSCNDWQPKS